MQPDVSESLNNSESVVLNIVILAAGKGSRMLSDCPKVMHYLSGRPIISYVISTAKELLKSNPGTITVVTGYGSDRVDPLVLDLGCKVVHQDQQLGTGHALSIVLNKLDSVGITLVLSGDVPLIKVEDLMPLLIHGASQLAVLTTNLEDPTGYGRIIRNESGQFIAIVEQKDASKEQLSVSEVNSGVYAGPTALFKKLLPEIQNKNSQGEYYLTDCIELSNRAGEPVITVEGSIEATMGVNDHQQLASVNALHQNVLRDQLLKRGVQMLDPNSVYIFGVVTIGRDVVIEPNVSLNGHIDIGDRVRIGFGSCLSDALIGSDSVIKPYTVIESSSVGCSAKIGPFSRLRPGTDLGDETHVGNFCETKNSRIGAKSKINHLSYVGDSVIGLASNIGAGTITCNYDGANKYNTTIGDDVFVGSNTSLIAPVTINNGATIGAGSVVTKDVGTDELAVARGKQINIPGYSRPKKLEG